VIRKGFEDYELLAKLEKAVTRPARKSAPGVDRGRKLLDYVRKTVAPDPARHTRDDALLLGTRREAGDILASLSPE
jgi:hypothetical protein